MNSTNNNTPKGCIKLSKNLANNSQEKKNVSFNPNTLQLFQVSEIKPMDAEKKSSILFYSDSNSSNNLPGSSESLNKFHENLELLEKNLDNNK